jgi:hypothetical protein
MLNQRRFVRFDSDEILEVRPLSEKVSKYKTVAKDLSLLGICFFSDFKWDSGQGLEIDYFLSGSVNPVKIKARVVWSELISDSQGFLVGVEIININDNDAPGFVAHYFKKVKDKFFE